ncbi:FAD-dependent oxidoreductase [Microbacterium profundi]|uniref:FAD-dependent oxidoreductase n=1 Tax=Microbacterium profundi TaxID=450380 RepID=UPI001F46C66B|nr:FAD-dependent oxidoreductase [Microbacterium profundi]MCE7481540.1 FAD-dependent oxidoreductase [Microbacterium profundi]
MLGQREDAELDVLVVGGGAAGVPAAIQAASMGGRTMLVEKNGALGGTTTVAGVALPGLFHAWGHQVIAGIGWRMVTKAVQVAGDVLPDFSDWRRPHYKLQVPVSAALYAGVLDAEVLQAGVDLRLHTMLGALEPKDDGWTVTLCDKEGLYTVRARRIVDCSGDADAAALAGLERLRNEQRQPGTIMVRFGGYDLDRLDIDALDAAHAQAVASGALRAEDLSMTERPMARFLRGHGENAIHVTGIEGGTSLTRTAAEIEGRRTLARIYGFLRRQPGLERVSIESWAVECGIRETFTIDGHERITVQDYVSGRRWEDAVSHSFYPIDVHQPDGDGIDIRPLEYGTVPSIPRGAMIPRGSAHLIVAGRAVAGDQEANSAYRVQASCMAMGQAAGANAALSASAGVPMSSVPLVSLRDELRAGGAILPGDVAIAPLASAQSRS